MTKFGTWIRLDYAACETTEYRDLANLAAQLYDAASPFEALQDKATDPRLGLVQPVTVAEAEALNDALDACKEFQEKWS